LRFGCVHTGVSCAKRKNWSNLNLNQADSLIERDAEHCAVLGCVHRF
jgi:hypothetical protein